MDYVKIRLENSFEKYEKMCFVDLFDVCKNWRKAFLAEKLYFCMKINCSQDLRGEVTSG